MEQLTVVKIGGKVIDSEEQLAEILKDFAQIEGNKVLIHGGGTLASEFGKKLGVKANQEGVKQVAAEMAKNLASKNIENVVFDRNGYLYHGVVASFADALREAGIKF